MDSDERLLARLIRDEMIKPSIKSTIIIRVLSLSIPKKQLRRITDEVLECNFKSLNEKNIEEIKEALAMNLIEELSIKSNIAAPGQIDDELKAERFKRKKLEEKIEQISKELRLERARGDRSFLLTEAMKPIVVKDEEIDELYRAYQRNGQMEYKDAFIVGKIIPKTYYKIR